MGRKAFCENGFRAFSLDSMMHDSVGFCKKSAILNGPVVSLIYKKHIKMNTAYSIACTTNKESHHVYCQFVFSPQFLV